MSKLGIMLLDGEATPLIQEVPESSYVYVGSELLAIAEEVLNWYGLNSYALDFIRSQDGLAVLANCCNAAAKDYDNDLYLHKPRLIVEASQNNPGAWANEGIVYIETPHGQMSFHVFEDEDDGLPAANGRTWSGIPLQPIAREVALAFLQANGIQAE